MEDGGNERLFFQEKELFLLENQRKH